MFSEWIVRKTDTILPVLAIMFVLALIAAGIMQYWQSKQHHSSVNGAEFCTCSCIKE